MADNLAEIQETQSLDPNLFWKFWDTEVLGERKTIEFKKPDLTSSNQEETIRYLITSYKERLLTLQEKLGIRTMNFGKDETVALTQVEKLTSFAAPFLDNSDTTLNTFQKRNLSDWLVNVRHMEHGKGMDDVSVQASKERLYMFLLSKQLQGRRRSSFFDFLPFEAAITRTHSCYTGTYLAYLLAQKAGIEVDFGFVIPNHDVLIAHERDGVHSAYDLNNRTSRWDLKPGEKVEGVTVHYVDHEKSERYIPWNAILVENETDKLRGIFSNLDYNFALQPGSLAEELDKSHSRYHDRATYRRFLQTYGRNFFRSAEKHIFGPSNPVLFSNFYKQEASRFEASVLAEKA